MALGQEIRRMAAEEAARRTPAKPAAIPVAVTPTKPVEPAPALAPKKNETQKEEIVVAVKQGSARVVSEKEEKDINEVSPSDCQCTASVRVHEPIVKRQRPVKVHGHRQLIRAI